MEADATLESFPKELQPLLENYWQRLVCQSTTALTPELCQLWLASDYAAELTLSHPEYLTQSATEPSDYLSDLATYCADVSDNEQFMQRLRQFRHRQMLTIIARDIGQLANFEQTALALSALADACIKQSLAWLTQSKPLAARLLVIAVGKLGGNELNFSSDIDLIFAFEGSASETNDFCRIGQDLIKLLQTPTPEGFVFRVDMRLRPYGDSGSLVYPLSALENYYQEQGREWERYALVKARIINPSSTDSNALQQILKRFVYRNYVDYGVIEALRSMKRLLEREWQNQPLANDIKRGKGGIRQIEFIVQCFQLIRGGQEPSLQNTHLLTSMAAMQSLQLLPQDVLQDLLDAYWFLRQLENRLQMLKDQQTHALPNDELAQQRLAFSMAYPDWPTFLQTCQSHCAKVAQHFDNMLQPSKHHSTTTITQQQLAAIIDYTHLQQLGYQDITDNAALLHNFLNSYRCRQLTGEAQQRLYNLLPIFIEAIATVGNSTETLLRVVQLLEATIRRSVYLAMLLENPAAVAHVVKLFAQSPWLADTISHYPLLLDELLDAQQLYRPIPVNTLANHLQQRLISIPEQDLELQMEVLRQFKLSQTLRVAAADINNILPLTKISDHLSYAAEAIVKHVQEIVWKQLSSSHDFENSDFAIIAYGKLGSLEMSYASDIDLVFLYQGPIAKSDLFIRLAQRIIHFIEIRTSTGILYQADTRLRPSGSAGLLVSHIDAFADYQHKQAWPWEHQALVRARAITGSPELKQQFQAIRQQVLSHERSPMELSKAVIDMREKMLHSTDVNDTEWFNVRHDRGGMTDIEFIVQYCVLLWAKSYPQLTEKTSNLGLLPHLAELEILTESAANLLANAYQAYRHVVHQATLQKQDYLVPNHQFSDLRQGVLQLWQQLLITPKDDPRNRVLMNQ